MNKIPSWVVTGCAVRKDRSWIAIMALVVGIFIGLCLGDKINDSAHRARAERQIQAERALVHGWR